MMSTPQLPPLDISQIGANLLRNPLLNKGSAFTTEERQEFHLHGLLPDSAESIEQQVTRAYQQYDSYQNLLKKHIYLRHLQDRNETLFYRLVQDHLSEMVPVIYTPTVGTVCQRYSHLEIHPRGLFLSYPERHRMGDLLRQQAGKHIKIAVVTDGERVLGLGDLGIGGMGISIGKLSLYTLCGGISPEQTLPICLDVGTNNQDCLADPLYLGWRHPRITGEAYKKFVDQFIDTLQRYFPEILLQFEDFAQHNAATLLQRYQDRLCCFNDDIQGTAAVTLGTLLAASRATDTPLHQQRIVIAGAGSAGCGIAELIIAQMKLEGLTEIQARQRIFLVGSTGLLTDTIEGLTDIKRQFSHPMETLTAWQQKNNHFSLLEVVQHAKPTVLIGVSGKKDLFDETLVRTLTLHCTKPIIMPLSNPTSHAEAHPADLLKWSDGGAFIATGSPFAPVTFNGKSYIIAQCNNAYIFPGIGLGVLSCKVKRITQNMLIAASHALASSSPAMNNKNAPLLPPMETIQELSKTIAFQVGKAAEHEGLADTICDEMRMQAIEQNFWQPLYRDYHYRPL